MELIYGENFVYPHPHVTFYVIDKSEIDDQTPALPDTAIMVMYILSDEGLDDRFIKFSGGNALSEFRQMYGKTSVKKHGTMANLAEKHLMNGGVVIARRITAPDASLANALVSLTADEVSSHSIYVEEVTDDEGNTELKVETEQNEDETLEEVTLSSYELGFNQEHISDAPDAGEIDIVANEELDDDISSGEIKLPLYNITALGRGRWGNNLKLYFNPTQNTYEDHQMVNFQLGNTAKGEIIDDYSVSHVPDLAQNGVPVNLPDVVSQFSGKAGLTFYENNYFTFDDEFATMVEDVISELESVTTEVDLEPLIDKLNGMLEDINDPDFGYLDMMELFDDMFKDDDMLNAIFPNNPLDSIELDEGHDGALGDMRTFDWNYEAEVDGEQTKVLEDMFVDAWSGVTDPAIMDFTKINADLVLDCGYPQAVKEAISGLVKMKRQDMAYLMSPPKNIKSLDQLSTYHSTFNPDNNQLCKIGQTCEWRDDAGRVHRVPVPYLLYTNLIDHFMTGYDVPFAGDNVYISGMEPGSLLPQLNGPKDKAKMKEMEYNYVSKEGENYFLDGQATAHLGGYSKLKELFNIFIKGRIMKTALPLLDSKKHKLDTAANIESIRSNLEDTLNMYYGSKVEDITVEAFFRNEQERARGDVTVEIYVTPHGSIKRFRALMYIMPKAG